MKKSWEAIKRMLPTVVVVATVLAGTVKVFADLLTIDFDSYTLGTVNGQDGWSSLGSVGSGCAVYDVAVVSNTYGYASFGTKSLRISNAVTSGCFGDHTFSKSLTDEAGESTSSDAYNGGLSGGTRQPYFEAEWDFASTVPGAEQAGLSVVASPDRGDGARMSWVQMTDKPSGLEVNFYDYQISALPPTGDFVFTNVISGLDRTVPHRIKITMTFVDGPENDIVEIYVDDVLLHTGTSWEDYFRQNQAPGTRTVDAILFRVGGTSAPATAGKGFLIDNFNSFSGPVPAKPNALVADTQITLDRFGFVEGDLHSNGGIEYDNGKPSTHTGNAIAVGAISVERDNTITGDLTAGGAINVHAEATVNGVVTSSATVDPLAMPTLSFSCPTSNGSITAAKDKTKNVVPGDYNTLRADKNAQLNFVAGSYSVKTLRFDDRSRMYVDVSGGDVTINVCTEINFIKNADIIISGGDSKDLTLNFIGTKKVVLGKDGGYQGSFYAPNAAVDLGSNAGFLGTIWAKSITVNKDARVRHHDFGPSVPKGQPQDADDEEAVAAVITDFALEQNYPNPFNPSTKLRFALPEAGLVTLQIYDVNGAVVQTIVSGLQNAGAHEVVWDGRNRAGQTVAAGTYLYRMTVQRANGEAEVVLTKKMTMLK